VGRPTVVSTATLTCPFGAAPATLLATGAPTVLIEGKPAATITDSAPMVNVASFGMCTSLANPTVAAATAAALGVLTPMPCVPATTPWVNGALQTMIGGRPALTIGAVCTCAFGGVIQVVNPASTRTLAG
jgi:uncharacterized Zn-binding protein involved in type VI secretion